MIPPTIKHKFLNNLSKEIITNNLLNIEGCNNKIEEGITEVEDMELNITETIIIMDTIKDTDKK